MKQKSLYFIFILAIFIFHACDCSGPRIPEERKVKVSTVNGLKFSPKAIIEEDKKLKYLVEVQYPVISGINNAESQKKLNLLIAAAAFQEIDKFKASITGWNEEEPDLEVFEGSSSLYMDYQIVGANQQFVSLKLNFSVYFAGAVHPNPSFMTINYDLQNNKMIQLAELFEPSEDYLGKISNYCINDLITQSEFSDEEWIKGGASRSLKNYQHFNLSKQGIVFTFDVYQVAPYAVGPQEVTIPYSVLRPILNPASPVTALLSKV